MLKNKNQAIVQPEQDSQVPGQGAVQIEYPSCPDTDALDQISSQNARASGALVTDVADVAHEVNGTLDGPLSRWCR